MPNSSSADREATPRDRVERERDQQFQRALPRKPRTAGRPGSESAEPKLASFSATPDRNAKITTLESATSRELEIAQMKLAIAEIDAGIIRMETALASMRQKQTARHREVARHEDQWS